MLIITEKVMEVNIFFTQTVFFFSVRKNAAQHMPGGVWFYS